MEDKFYIYIDKMCKIQKNFGEFTIQRTQEFLNFSEIVDSVLKKLKKNYQKAFQYIVHKIFKKIVGLDMESSNIIDFDHMMAGIPKISYLILSYNVRLQCIVSYHITLYYITLFDTTG